MASTTTQILLSSSSPSFSTTPWNCEVFISFDSFGNNNRFVEDLRNALEERAIIVLRGDEEMKREERIFQKHSKAIEESRYAVVVISQDYVLSERCLKELTKIMEQRRDRHLKVLPVFHDLDPFDVRNLKGCVEKAFANCIDERVEEELKSWRAAVEEVGDCLVDLPDGGRQRGCLTDSSARNRGDPSVETKPCEECRVDLIEAGQLVGWYVQNRSKLTVIKEISAAIFGGLMRNLPEVPRFLVGMDSVVKEIWGLLHKRSVRDIGNSSDVYYLRICGEKGIGKTTLARVIYEKFSSHFTASCFIPSIGGASGKDIVCLQKYLMSEILTPIEANALNDWDDISEGVELLKSKLCTKKVLIVLDDVYLKEQLEALAGEPMWFGRGSTIIITSEYGYVSLGAIYRVGELNEDDALRLFCSKAFNKCHPKEDFLGLIRDIIPHVPRIPLVLGVLGSYLKSAEKSVWESLEVRLKANTCTPDVLEIAVDGLSEWAQEVFLDIACCYNGWSTDDVLSKLQSSESILKDLEHKSLIKFSANKKLIMHELLVKTGQKIAQQKRLLRIKDIIAMPEKTRTYEVQGICLDLSLPEVKLPDVMKSFREFSRMKNLRVLRITYDDNDLGCISLVQMIEREMKESSSKLQLGDKNLRAMEWWGYPLESLPTFGFQPDNLVMLILRYSYLKRLWYGRKWLSGLKCIDLSFSMKLIEMPDLRQFSNLEILDLSFCKCLFTVHPSIGCHERLKKLLLKGCCSIEKLLDEINLKSVEVLDLSLCSKLNKFPDIAKNMSFLKYLDISESAIKELPLSFKRLQFLEEFHAKGSVVKESSFSVVRFRKLGYLDLSSTTLTRIPYSVNQVHNLVKLSLSNCSQLKELPNDFFLNLRSLLELDLSGCNLGKVPTNLGCCSLLSDLNLSKNKFTKLPKSLGKLSVLLKLSLSYCSELKELPKGFFSGLTSLSELDLSYCNLSNGAIPEDLCCCSLLLDLNLSGNKFTKLPEKLPALSILRTLRLDDCTSLQSLPNLPLSLFYLKLKNCPVLVPFDQQPDVGIPSEMLKQCVCSSTVACIGFDDRPYKTLYLHSQSPSWQNDRPYYISPVVSCGTTEATGIPHWFTKKRTSSSETKIRMDSDSDSRVHRYLNSDLDLDLDLNLVGPQKCALMIVIKGGNRILPEFVCQIGFNEASSEDTLTFCLPKISFIGSTGMWVFINLPYSWRTSKSLNRRSHWVSIATGSMNVEFSCGARLLNFSNDPKWLLDSGSNPDHVLTEEDSVRLINFSRSRVQRKFHYDSDFYKVIRRVAGHAFNMQFLRDSILGSVTVRGPIKDQKLS